MSLAPWDNYDEWEEFEVSDSAGFLCTEKRFTHDYMPPGWGFNYACWWEDADFKCGGWGVMSQ